MLARFLSSCRLLCNRRRIRSQFRDRHRKPLLCETPREAKPRWHEFRSHGRSDSGTHTVFVYQCRVGNRAVCAQSRRGRSLRDSETDGPARTGALNNPGRFRMTCACTQDGIQSRRNLGDMISNPAGVILHERMAGPKNNNLPRHTDFSHLIPAGNCEGEIIPALLLESMNNLTVCFLGSSFMSAGVYGEPFWNPQCEFPPLPRPV